MNIDACRVPYRDGEGWSLTGSRNRGFCAPGKDGPAVTSASHPGGRWPPNILLGHPEGCACTTCPLAVLDAEGAHDPAGASRIFPTFRLERKARGAHGKGEGNTHPTVKPLPLMRWLVRLLTPAGGTVLDPFAGSGTTLVAARDEGLDAVGIELVREHVAIARRRLRTAS